MPCTSKLLCKMAPIIAFVSWYMIFMVLGFSALLEDQALRNEICGHSTHVWKYALINVGFVFFSFITYFVFPGGGEGARARATLLTIIHIGFAGWGILMWIAITDTCAQVLSGQFKAMDRFHKICVVHNCMLATMFLAHEMFLADSVGYDFTVIAEIRKDSSSPYSPQESTALNPSYVAQPITPSPVTAMPPELVAATTSGNHTMGGSPNVKDAPPELKLGGE